ncbi:MAG: transcriptional regulator, partial [Rhodospirillaceae bacterium]|nr:transcriptional regulator [Rhodospirillaceae bacterium]
NSIRTIYGRGFRFVAAVSGRTEDSIAQSPEQIGPSDRLELEAKADTKPSIAVLPFQLLGAPGDHGAIADAIPHEITQALSRLRWLFVIARGSAFQFREPDPNVREIGKALSVRYCLVGSVEISDRTIAVTVELSDVNDGGVVWGERFAATIDDVHEIRAEIVAHVVPSLEIHIPMNEARVARLGVPESLDAWSNYHLGLHHMYRFTRQDNAKATALFKSAVAQEPSFARAYAGLSFTNFQDAFVKYNNAPDKAALDARRFAERSLELDPYDPFANLTMGRSFWLQGEPEFGIDWLERATSLSPNYAQGFYSRAFADMLSGRADSSHDFVDISMSLSPLDPLLYGMLGTRAISFVIECDYESAAFWAEKAARAPGAHFLIYLIAVIAHSLNQNDKKASQWVASTRQRKPTASQADFFDAFPFSDPNTRKLMSGALSRHGI